MAETSRCIGVAVGRVLSIAVCVLRGEELAGGGDEFDLVIACFKTGELVVAVFLNVDGAVVVAGDGGDGISVAVKHGGAVAMQQSHRDAIDAGIASVLDTVGVVI